MIDSALHKDHATLTKAGAFGSGFRAALIILVLSLFTAAVLLLTPLSSVGLESAHVLWVGGGLLAALCLALGLGRTRASNAQKAVFALWGFLLISEEFFSRVGTIDSAFAGSFNVSAYGEACIWVLSLLILIPLFWGSPVPLGKMFSGQYKWVVLFAAVCLASCVYSPRPGYSAAWALKLGLVILLLHLCSAYITDLRDIDSFLRLTFWALTFLVIYWVFQGNGTEHFFDEQGRLIGADGLSATAGTLLLLCLTLFSSIPGWGLRKAAIAVGGIVFIIMIVAGGKAGIVAGLMAAVIFFVLRRGFGSAARFLIGASVLSAVLVMVTPLGKYLRIYSDLDQAGTLTGRTPLWQAAFPAILQKPIIGHGYVSSAFVSVQVNGIPWEAGHMHNGFLEALYNTGLVGLFLILAVHFVIARNLLRVIRREDRTSYLYQLGVGCFAVYLDLFINGFANASFAGRAWHPFMLLLALVVISEKLYEFSLSKESRSEFRSERMLRSSPL
jgi:exopolysaccharide production protein ExoQ